MAGNYTKESNSNVSQYVERARGELGSMKEKLHEVRPHHDDVSPGDGHHGHSMGSVREAVHHGKHIVIRTTYEITVDGEKLNAHLGVSDNGAVHYHGLPNYAFTSMMELVRKVIDASDAELPVDEIGNEMEGH